MIILWRITENPLCRKCQKNGDSDSKKPVMYNGRGKTKKKSTPEAKKLFSELKKRRVPAELEKWDGYKHIDIAVVNAIRLMFEILRKEIEDLVDEEDLT
jgi:hypothetical protein